MIITMNLEMEFYKELTNRINRINRVKLKDSSKWFFWFMTIIIILTCYKIS